MTEHDHQPWPDDAALSRRYREASEAADMAPPPALDARILAAARAAVQPPPRPARPWWQRLTLPVGIAATTLLAVMLSLTVQRQTPETLERERTESKAPAAADAPRESPPQTQASPAAARADSAPPAPAGRAEREPAVAGKKTIAAPAAPAAMPAPAAQPEIAAPPPAPALSNEAATVSSRLKAEAAADRAQETEARAPLQKAAPAAAAAPARPGIAKGEVLTPVQAWIEEIRELRRQGREDEATRRLAEFRKAYPGYALPEDLR